MKKNLVAGLELGLCLCTRAKKMRAGVGRSRNANVMLFDTAETSIVIGVALGILVIVGVLLWYYLNSRREMFREYEEHVQLTSMEHGEQHDDVQSAADESSESEEEVPPLPRSHAAPLSHSAPPRYSPLELRQLEADGNTANCWSACPTGTFSVRAPSYLRDGQKAPSEPASLLLAVELFRSSEPVFDVGGRDGSPVETLGRRCAPTPLHSVFVVNLLLPALDGFYQLVLYFGVLSEPRPPSFARLLERFVHGTDAFRAARFKLIPSVAVGPWLVQKSVGSRPSILGKSLRQRFHRGDGYFEVGIDCNSSPAAGRIVSLVKSYAKELVVDLAFVIEAKTAEELGERVLGCARLMHVELGGEEDAVPHWDSRAAEAL